MNALDNDSNPAKRFAPSTMRNRAAIVDVLRGVLPAYGLVLEIASGSGEHIIHFAKAFPALQWQPSDPDTTSLASINAWRDESGLSNVKPPFAIDAAATGWPITAAAAILCINMIHISPWAATRGLFRGAASVLGQGAPLYLYGPYLQQGIPVAASNVAFDASLKDRNPEWGLRHVDDVIDLARAHGFDFETVVEMPANNLSLLFRRLP